MSKLLTFLTAVALFFVVVSIVNYPIFIIELVWGMIIQLVSYSAYIAPVVAIVYLLTKDKKTAT